MRTLLIQIFIRLFISLNIIKQAYSDNYLGCFNDHANDPDMPYFLISNGQVSIDTCSRVCAESGYKYAGLQNGYFEFKSFNL